MSKKVLVIAAHPDDEVLGCGGTMAWHVSKGDTVAVLFIADGVGARNDNFAANLKNRKDAALSAMEILGTKILEFLDLPDNRLDTIPLLDIVHKVESHINKFKPDMIYTHHYGDLNVDHSIVHRATMTACRPQPGFFVKEIYTYEVLSATDWSLNTNVFMPNCFVNIEKQWDQKKQALHSYKTEIREYPHTRSIDAIESLCKNRGSSVGLEKAEAFCMIRSIRE